MQWVLWQKPVAQELSDQLKKRLIAQFSLDSQTVDKMRFSGKKGRYSERRVKYIRIFDPVLIEDGKSATPSYNALAQIPGQQSALLFDGRIETNERVYFTDRRTTPASIFPLW